MRYQTNPQHSLIQIVVVNDNSQRDVSVSRVGFDDRRYLLRVLVRLGANVGASRTALTHVNLAPSPGYLCRSFMRFPCLQRFQYVNG
jgi:hypothetical protein